MDELEPGAVQLELKYCERCGGLWLRLRGSDLVFCGACAKIMAGLWPRYEREGQERGGQFRHARIPEDGSGAREGMHDSACIAQPAFAGPRNELPQPEYYQGGNFGGR